MSAWGSVPFWSIAQRRERTGYPKRELLSVYREWGVVKRSGRDDNFNRASEDLSNYKLVHPGDLVLNKMKTWQGSLGVSAYEGIVSPAYFVCEVMPTMDGRFLHHLLRCRRYIAYYEAGSKGIRPNQWDLPYDVLRQIPVLKPPIGEQRRIADFLDDRVSRIDRIIAARREQVALVEMQQSCELQRIFDSAATENGLLRVGHILRRLEQGWSPQAEAHPADLGEWGVMRSGCVNGGRFRAEDNKRLPDDLEPVRDYEIHGGDLLMSRASGSLDLIGSIAVVPMDVRPQLILCDKVYRLSLIPAWDADFVARMLSARSNRELIRLGVSGAEGMANNLPSGVIRDLRVPAVGTTRQEQLVLEVKSLNDRANRISTGLGHSIALLAEYKSSLITAAVTGELDVTTAGSNLPG